MEAPTSRYTGSNLYNREHWFSLAPPCHHGFSGFNQMEATTSCVQASTWTAEDNSPPKHLPTSLEYKWLNKHSTLQINQFLPIFLFSVNLISAHCSAALLFLCLFSRYALHQLVLSFFSYSTRSVILLCISSHNSHMLNLLLHMLFFSIVTVSFFFTYRTTNPTQSISSSFIHTNMTVQLPNSLGKKTTTV